MLLKERDTGVLEAIKSGASKAKVKPTSKKFTPSLLESYLYYGFCLFLLSFLLGGVIHHKNQLAGSWESKLDQFRWIVLVKGDQLQVDEVGRYLKQADGVKKVSFVSAEKALSELQNNPVFGEDLKDLDSALLPSTWEIQWQPNYWVEVDSLTETVSEILVLPAVLDVAYDLQAWNQIKELRKSWAELRLLLSAFILFSLVGIVLFVGQSVFFRPVKWIGTKKAAFIFFNSFVWWSAGVFIFSQMVSPLPLMFLLGGLGFGLLHLIWRCRIDS